MHECWTEFWASHILGAFGKATYSGLRGWPAGLRGLDQENLKNY
jgi:hypothetical protein